MSVATATPTGTLLRLATAGSVDDGKSTLVGRLLHDSKAVLADQLASVERVSRERGLTQTDLALLTDGLRAERTKGFPSKGGTYVRVMVWPYEVPISFTA